MTAPQTSRETPLWRFSLAFYRQPGVSEACIALQDDCGVDVNLLLFLFWLAAEGRQVTPAEVNQIDETARGWRELTIIPLRRIRRALKGAATMVSPDRKNALRERIKAVELEAERLQQEAFYALAQAAPPGRPAAPAAAAPANLDAYRASLGAAFPDQTVQTLLGALARSDAAVPH
jgi:uncharacterized protein (TIGR02444 family)